MDETSRHGLPKVEPEAVRILIDTYWGRGGWEKDWAKPDPPLPPTDDYEFAVRAGVMFAPEELSHDDVVARARELGQLVELRHAADAFLVSLSTRRLDLRSALGSLAVARALPAHSFVGRLYETGCVVCGSPGPKPTREDLNVLNFERFRWGGVRRLDPRYVAFDLERFLDLPPVEPSAEDTKRARSIFACLEAASTAGATPAALVRALKGIFRATEEERRVVIEILACWGIVQPRSLPSLQDRWTNFFDRPCPPGRANDWSFPVYVWRGDDGIDLAAIERVFYCPT